MPQFYSIRYIYAVSISINAFLFSSRTLENTEKTYQFNLNFCEFLQKQKKKLLQLRKRGICRAELQQEAPFAIAIGACMLNSLLFSDTSVSSSEDEDAEISSTDARFAIMTIISLIPYFNWLVSSYCAILFIILHCFSIWPILMDYVMLIELDLRIDGYRKTTLCCVCYCIFGPLLQVCTCFLLFNVAL